jgi:hypothetical protein
MVDRGYQGDFLNVARLVRGSLQDGSNPASASAGGGGYDPNDSLVPDPRGTAGVFANVEGGEGDSANYVAYSADGGQNWTQVSPPRGVTSFAVAADPLVVGGLVATAYDRQFPPGRRWYSTDGGSHWTAGMCAGDYRAICPTAVLPAAARGGASVAINRRGIYTFRGDAGASGRATIALPVPPSAVSDAQGDLKLGHPIYLLARANSATAAIYRSLDGGAIWTRVRYPAPH